jgi:type II secretory pathway component GspD/PulD (secretin)
LRKEFAVLTLRRFLCLALPAAVLLAPIAASAQDADTAKAKDALNRGLGEYKALKFSDAKKTLVGLSTQKDQANKKDLKEYLSQQEKKTLDDTLAKLDDAISKQSAAMEAYTSAKEALAKNDLAKAKEGFTAAAASEFLDPALRKSAQDELAKVNEKIKVAPSALPSAQPSAKVASAGTDKTATQPAASTKDPKKVEEQILATAHRYLEAGKVALAESKAEEAANLFGAALKLVPTMQEAKDLLRKAQGQAGPTESGIIGKVEKNKQIVRQMADAEFDKAMKTSLEALAAPKTAADFSKAEEAARLALNILDTNKTLYDGPGYNDRLGRANDQIRWTRQQREAWEKNQVLVAQREIDRANDKRIQREQEAHRQKIDTHIARARTLRKEQNFQSCLEELEQILKLDPVNRWASEQKEMLEQFHLLRGEKEPDVVQRIEEQKQFIDLRWAEVPWYDILRYPKDWKEITARRESFEAGTSGESEKDREVQRKLKQTMPKLVLPNTPLQDVIQFIRDVSGTNIYVNWTALQAAGIDKTTQVDVHLQDVTVEKALKVVLEYVGGATTQLSFVMSDGVIKISTKDDLNRDTITRVYDIRDLIVRVPNFVGPRIDLASIGQNVGNNNAGGTTIFDNANANNNAGVDPIPTKKEMIAEIIATIKETVDPDSWRDKGTVGSIRELSGQLIVTQTAESHNKLLNLIKQLREARAIQIAVEARFIEVSTGYLNSIGLNLDLFFNLGSRLGSNLVRDPATGAITSGQVYDPWSGAFVPTAPPGSTSAWGQHRPGSDNWTPIGVHGIQSTNTFGNMLGKGTGIGSQIASPGLQIGGTFLDDIQVDFLIQATQAHSATRVLTAPRLTLFNGQRAYITVATERAYVAGYDPLVSENVAASRPIIRVLPTGTVLDVEATVSADRRYVTMTVRPQVNGQPTFESFAGVQLPTIRRQILETTVSCPDGGTLLMGGSKTANEIEQEIGVPLLSKVPIINRAFTNRGMVRDENMLLILIRPKIIIQSEEETKEGKTTFPGP